MAKRSEIPYYLQRVSRCASGIGDPVSRGWTDDGHPLPNMDVCAICGVEKGAKKRWARDTSHYRFLEKIIGHHIEPLRCGGAHCAGNLIFLCESCHGKVEAQVRKLCKTCDRRSCTAGTAINLVTSTRRAVTA